MHETVVTKEIFESVLLHAEKNNAIKVVSVNLRVGELSDLSEKWIQQFYDYFSKGTIAEGAKIVIKRSPIILQCDSCKANYVVKIEKIKDSHCPECGCDKANMVAGHEYYIGGIEILQ
ncbi:hydrogenase maturation nickel metallochaperone HypA [Acetobacterium wieringae]|uniref:Hydrogenase maturation factor HypA n=1 Tax=Acetobacterium wieringae TaxID=52694 RepID=A0ABY6HKF9_9FIRM|nr:hydrogenase maturation nickel metallochaperone HypA [Acetobacterium wieringae]UYO64359.1 hydrogenase maturation nickel metallochaperone HypA [Acetobacterium wieringae]VUZ27136.1 Hydrogenase maturation factor HypA [Acetobacterium wieringae]